MVHHRPAVSLDRHPNEGLETVLGLVLAAGQGQRLLPLTDGLPKTLLPIDGELTILDFILRNLAKVGITDITVVAGYAADALVARVPDLNARHGIDVTLVRNDRFDRNNAYSLWLAREVFAQDTLLVNGDTLHPVEFEHTLLTSDAGTDIILALDVTKQLTDEAMKVTLDDDGNARRITKLMPVDRAHGEYIGATLLRSGAANDLAEALHETWRRDPGLYYEDGYQALVDAGAKIGGAALPDLDWVEVDDHADLARARELACRV
jgi:choline kinase